MTAPPLTFGRVVTVDDDLVDVHVQGRRVRTIRAPELDQALIQPGDTVFVNDLMTVVAVEQPGTGGELAVVVEADHDTAVVRGGGDAEYRLLLAPAVAQAGPQAGDSLLVDRAAGVAFALVSRRHVEELVLTERPDVSYADIGGLGPQIERITDAVELPFRHRAAFERYQLRPPKGVLLYGPPGCGKTMIAKAVANSLAGGGGAELLPQHQGPRTAQQVRGRVRATDPADLPAGPRTGRRRSPGDRLLRRDGLAVPHPRHGRVLRRGEHHRPAAAQRDRRRRGPDQRDHHRRLQPGGHDRPGDPACRTPGRQDQTRPSRPRRGRRDHRQVPARPTCRCTRTRLVGEDRRPPSGH